ncbi:uncharacterized protein LOC128992436 [Macrosteles quadrilineatus]|uniref:uncharacterized protein LOC128992436 n=1 Tax=Macrosteles quadrilineatus TaxID=74068 RepID=UPI0023E28937|nr:uncharacterized protein LOC128992436 [Macrosteles quadrilineatus]
MDLPMSPERSKVLSDIEQSIQNALALFNTKDLDLGIDQPYVIDDPIVSLHDPKTEDPEKRLETSNSRKSKEVKNMYTPRSHLNQDENQQFYDALPFTDTKMSKESIDRCFLQDPVKSTFEEMQRVLNTKTETFSPRSQSVNQQFSQSPKQMSSSPKHVEPSPEEILNIFSQDLGINYSPNVTPRVIYQNINTNDYAKPKEKKDKKPKQLKLKEKKVETGKRKSAKQEITQKDNKMKELMNIYGCGDKMKKLNSDSTIGSKSMSKIVSRKQSSVNKISSKASSVAMSRKSKIKYKITNDLDMNFSEGDSVPIEKSSRLSTKRKNKQKINSVKPIKNPSLKRKFANKQIDEENLKPSKNLSSYRNKSYETQKNNVKTYKDSQNGLLKNKNLTHSYHNPRDNINSHKTLNVNDVEVSKKEDFTVLHAIPDAIELVAKTSDLPSETQGEKQSTSLNKPSKIADVGKDQNITKKVSEEKNLNKPVTLKNDVHQSYKTEYNDMSDYGNELEHPNQFHYTLPTHSSKSKEVERFLNGHYQHTYLPFVIGQSTNKSHNLWVNIQEALSLIKNNIPQTIEIQNLCKESDKDSERPLTVLSKFSTKSKKPHQCPALMHDGLYDIPETSREMEDGARWEDHPDCVQANLDPNFCRPRCSCVPQGTLSYKKVLQQIFLGEDATEGPTDPVDQGESYTGELRKALIAFTQEFEDLNNKYDRLLSDPESSKEELQQLEAYLETKEEEIRKIIARINEVKELGEKSRAEYGRGASLEAYRSTTSVQLRQTLRRVQQFKEDIRSKPTTRNWSRTSCVKSLY